MPVFRRMFPGLVVAALLVVIGSALRAAERPNVVLIVCDDLNDYVSALGGHPQSQTPHIAKLAEEGVSFRRAYSNNPICAPSRASFVTGIYAHHSRNFTFDKWYENPVLKNSKTLMQYFRENGYYVVGSGKLMHHPLPSEWNEYEHKPDYGPFVFDGNQRVAHPAVPEPFRSIGPVDGSFAPLSAVPYPDDRTGTKGWIYGTWGKPQYLRYRSEDDRDPTPDERNARWAADRLRRFAADRGQRPFLLAVGFIRPHTPLHVPQRYFDMFPTTSLALPVIKPNDAADCHYADVYSWEQKGLKYFRLLKQSYPTMEDGLKAFLQAYLASVAAVDDCIGQVIAAVDATELKDNTIVVVTSDHGWTMGQKDYLFKNSLWEESTRVPLVIRAPRVAVRGGVVEHPVALIDLYPTLADLCSLQGDTRKNDQGHRLDGRSLRPFLENPNTQQWDGPEAALSMIYAGGYSGNDPARQHWSVRTRRWRYILYNNGAEELYDHDADPHEWTNLAEEPRYGEIKKRLRAMLFRMTERDDAEQ